MKPGSVIVDLAVEAGGNCELSEAGKVVKKYGVTLVGHINVPSRLATDASSLYAKNILNLLNLLIDKDRGLSIKWDDDIVKGIALTRDGAIIHPQFGGPQAEPAKATGTAGRIGIMEFLLNGLTVFVLACFVGYYVVWRVTPALHSPLMAVTNAISSVIIVGALIAAGPAETSPSKIMGFVAVILASVNIFGGFLVTRRMLAMFKKKAG